MAKRKPTVDGMIKYFIRHYNIPTRKDIDKLTERINRLEKIITTTMGSGPDNQPPGKNSPRSGTLRDKPRVAASDTVLEIIKSFNNKGVGFSEIQDRTGFEEKKLRNIIYRLSKTGRIKSKGRGIYVASSLAHTLKKT